MAVGTPVFSQSRCIDPLGACLRACSLTGTERSPAVAGPRSPEDVGLADIIGAYGHGLRREALAARERSGDASLHVSNESIDSAAGRALAGGGVGREDHRRGRGSLHLDPIPVPAEPYRASVVSRPPTRRSYA
jgi:hypothetical protein